MRKLILFNMITLDGFFAGPAGEIDWHQVDDEFNQYAIDQLQEAGGLIFGRVTYQLMASYWPTPQALQDDPQVAEKMNSLPKFVASRTLQDVEWSNTRLLKGDATEELSRLKAAPGADLFIFGSANLAAGLMKKSLIDEYRLIVNPVVIGKGIPMFQNPHLPQRFRLARTRAFRNSNVLLVYQPALEEE